MKDEKLVDQSIRWPRMHKQKKTKEIDKIISRIIFKNRKNTKITRKTQTSEIFDMRK